MDLANNNKLTNIADIANYIARYGSHPVISESRIVNVDYVNKTITWKFDPHEDDGLSKNDPKFKGTQLISEPIDDFIIKLIRHIPGKNFHLIRYFGFYSNNRKVIPNTNTILYFSKIRILKSMLKYPIMILNSFKFNARICKCGRKMKFDYGLSYFPMKGSLF